MDEVRSPYGMIGSTALVVILGMFAHASTVFLWDAVANSGSFLGTDERIAIVLAAIASSVASIALIAGWRVIDDYLWKLDRSRWAMGVSLTIVPIWLATILAALIAIF